MTDAMTPRQAIEFAVKTEELGEKFYKQLALKFSDQPELKELFELLAKDEVMHAAQFRKLLEADAAGRGRIHRTRVPVPPRHVALPVLHGPGRDSRRRPRRSRARMTPSASPSSSRRPRCTTTPR